MADGRLEIPLDSVRTDGWFARVGEGIGSFEALCDIIGERFFAFCIITGVRISTLTVDRRSPEHTVVEFVVGDDGSDVQQLSLVDFRQRLVGALLVDDSLFGPSPTRATDTEAIQLFIGVRYLLLAPLFGFTLESLTLGAEGNDDATLSFTCEGIPEKASLSQFRVRVRSRVREELDRTSFGSRAAIDLSQVDDAEKAAESKQWIRVVQLLGTWPTPLAIFLRTPEGQMLSVEARTVIARGLALLGSAYAQLGEAGHSEEVLRIGIQYAPEGPSAADLFGRLGEAMLMRERPGEAVGPLRRALSYGAPQEQVLPLLGRAFHLRRRYVAAVSCFRKAVALDASAPQLAEWLGETEAALGASLSGWDAYSGPRGSSVRPPET